MFKNDLLYYVCVCMYALMCMQFLKEARSLRTGIIGMCGSSHMGAGKSSHCLNISITQSDFQSQCNIFTKEPHVAFREKKKSKIMGR